MSRGPALHAWLIGQRSLLAKADATAAKRIDRKVKVPNFE